MSSVSRSVITVTLSSGATRRQVRTAFRAPGMRSSVYAAIVVRKRLSVRVRSAGSGRCGLRKFDAAARLFADEVYDALEIPAVLVEDPQLAVGAGSVLEDPADRFDLLAAAELVHDAVHEL